ncbi:MAG: hypothetical protein ABFS03_13355, partial [Chloroflexota bacterium]
MSETNQNDLNKIIESAQRLGVEIDEGDALQWLAAISAQSQSGDGVKMDERTGIFGHSISLLDFDDSDLAHFREIGRLVEFEDIPGQVETALALSGSAAQSKIQTYPGDADYFERVNITAPTRDKACKILANLMRDKALSKLKGETYQLIEVKFGSYPFDFYRDGTLNSKDNPIAWSPKGIQDRKLVGETSDGKYAEILWDDVSQDPGWCKLDWVVADPVRKQLV